MITIERTDQDGTIYIDVDQVTYEDLVELYMSAVNKEMISHGNEDVAVGAALMNIIEYSINVFMFDNKCIRPIRTPNRKRKKR